MMHNIIISIINNNSINVYLPHTCISSCFINGTQFIKQRLIKNCYILHCVTYILSQSYLFCDFFLFLAQYICWAAFKLLWGTPLELPILGIYQLRSPRYLHSILGGYNWVYPLVHIRDSFSSLCNWSRTHYIALVAINYTKCSSEVVTWLCKLTATVNVLRRYMPAKL